MANVDMLMKLLPPEEIAALVEILQNEPWLKAVLQGHVARQKARKGEKKHETKSQ